MNVERYQSHSRQEVGYLQQFILSVPQIWLTLWVRPPVSVIILCATKGDRVHVECTLDNKIILWTLFNLWLNMKFEILIIQIGLGLCSGYIGVDRTVHCPSRVFKPDYRFLYLIFFTVYSPVPFISVKTTGLGQKLRWEDKLELWPQVEQPRKLWVYSLPGCDLLLPRHFGHVTLKICPTILSTTSWDCLVVDLAAGIH